MSAERDPIGTVPELPAREPADHEVAAGAAAGVAAGLATLLAALAGTGAEQGSFFPLRLVAASLLGHEALDPGWVAPVLLGSALGLFTSVVLGLVFVSLLGRGPSLAASLGAGLVYGVVSWSITWWVVVRLVDPVLFSSVRPARALLLHLVFGAALGLVLPPLRRVLP
jgi:hypothetical protein